MAVEKTIKFRFPEAQDIDVHLVRLPDGRVVARTSEELVALPSELRVSLPPKPADEEEEG